MDVGAPSVGRRLKGVIMQIRTTRKRKFSCTVRGSKRVHSVTTEPKGRASRLPTCGGQKTTMKHKQWALTPCTVVQLLLQHLCSSPLDL